MGDFLHEIKCFFSPVLPECMEMCLAPPVKFICQDVILDQKKKEAEYVCNGGVSFGTEAGCWKVLNHSYRETFCATVFNGDMRSAISKMEQFQAKYAWQSNLIGAYYIFAFLGAPYVSDINVTTSKSVESLLNL